MSCENCTARAKLLRDALIQARIKETIYHAAVGIVEFAGLKDKTGLKDQARKNSGAAG